MYIYIYMCVCECVWFDNDAISLIITWVLSKNRRLNQATGLTHTLDQNCHADPGFIFPHHDGDPPLVQS